MIRTALVKEHGLYYNETYAYASDYDWQVRTLSLFPVALVNDLVYLYRIHAQQISTRKRREQDFFADQIRLKQLSFFGIDPTETEKALHPAFINGVIDHHFDEKMIDQWVERAIKSQPDNAILFATKTGKLFAGTSLSVHSKNQTNMNSYKKIIDILDVFVRKIAKTSEHIPQTGLMTGKIGVAVLLYHYARYKNEPELTKCADHLVDISVQGIGLDSGSSLDDGLCGIAWGFDYLIKQKFVHADEDIFEEIDDALFPSNRTLYLFDLGLESEKGLYAWNRFISCESPVENVWQKRIENCVCHLRDILLRRYTSALLPVFSCKTLIRFFHICQIFRKYGQYRLTIDELYEELPEIVKVSYREEKKVSDQYMLALLLADIPIFEKCIPFDNVIPKSMTLTDQGKRILIC